MNPIHNGNLQCFLDVYKIELEKNVKAKPDEYSYTMGQLDEVFGRMASAIERGTFSKESHSIRMTCKILKIKHTYKAIKEFISLWNK